MAEHPKNQSEPSKPHDLVKPGSTIDPKGQAAPPQGQTGGDQKQGQISTYGQNMPGETDAERMRREDPLFIEKTRPEDPSGRPGQLTRDNVNPHIPSVTREQLGPAIARIQNPGGIVDPTSLGMEQGGVAPTYPDASVSINEPRDAPPDLPPGHGNFSVNEPPGSNVGGDGSGTAPGPVTLTGVTPATGVIGVDVPITAAGTGFTEASVITFGGTALATTYGSATSLSATAPGVAAAEGPIDVTVDGSAPVVFTWALVAGDDPDVMEAELEDAEDDGDYTTSKKAKPKGKR